MKPFRLGLGAVLVLGIAFAVWSAREAPRTLYVGGPVITLNAQNAVVSGLGTDGNRIAIVGDEESVRAWGGEDARVVELAGRALLPGFIDAHGHFPGTGIYALVVDLNSPPIGDIETIDDLLDRMRTRAAETADGEWVVGFSYDDTLLAENRHPTRDDLDKVSMQHPVAVVHVSGHLAVVNSKALDALGLDGDTPDPVGGHLGRDATTGRLTGLLEETAMLEVMAGALAPGPLEALAVLQKGARDYVEAGVTTAQSGATTAAMIEGFDWASRLGLLPLRIVVWPRKETADRLLDGDWHFESHDEQWVRLGAVKMVADGSIQGFTGYLREPYYKPPPGKDPGYRGYPRILRDELIERAGRYHDAGLQIAIHGNGDASIDDILDAFEAAGVKGEDARPIVIHAQMTTEDQLDRMQELGVIPSFFVLHTFYWGDRHHDIFMGPQRAARMSPTRGALDRGLHFTIHADAPIVPMEPLRLVWSAVNRRTRSGRVLGPDQRIDVMDALRAVTLDAAYQHFEEGLKGSLEVGKLADLVILSESPLENPEAIDRIRVDETVVDGWSIYHREGS
jgi:predicted amidohydrolase YtcJ